MKWPRFERLWKTLPKDCRVDFHVYAVITHHFKLLSEQPTNLVARAQTRSKYKHHNSAKFLIGIAPEGVVTFISQGCKDGHQTFMKRRIVECFTT